jgi:hypothetical protein
MGLHRPVSVDVLTDLHRPYLDARGGARLRLEPLQDAVRWATTAVHATSSMLIPHEEGLLAFDYLIDKPRYAVPEENWAKLLAHVTPIEAYDVGWAAIDLTRPEQAIRAFDQARGHVEDADDSYLNALGNSGQTIWAAERFAVLVPLYESRFGAEHARTLRARRDHARYLGESGVARAAAELLADLTPLEERLFGPDHELTLTTRRLQGRFLCESGDFTRGLPSLEAVLADLAATRDQWHVDVLQARLELARYTAKSGAPQKAQEALVDLVADLRAALGAQHPLYVSSQFEYARALGEAGQPVAARELLRKHLDDQSGVLAEQHPRVLSTRHHLARHGRDRRPRRSYCRA